MLALQRSGAELRRDVIFAAVADEEAGGEHGARGTGRAAARPLPRCRRTPRRRRPERGRRLLDDDRRASLLRHPGRREGHRLDAAASDRDARPWLHAARRQCRHQAGRRLWPAAGRRAARRRASSRSCASFLEALGLGEVARPGRAGDGRRPPAASSAGSTTRSCAARSTPCCATPSRRPSSTSGKKVNVMPGTRRGGGRRPHPAGHRPGGASCAGCRRSPATASRSSRSDPAAVEWPADAEIVELMRRRAARAPTPRPPPCR